MKLTTKKMMNTPTLKL